MSDVSSHYPGERADRYFDVVRRSGADPIGSIKIFEECQVREPNLCKLIKQIRKAPPISMRILDIALLFKPFYGRLVAPGYPENTVRKYPFGIDQVAEDLFNSPF